MRLRWNGSLAAYQEYSEANCLKPPIRKGKKGKIKKKVHYANYDEYLKSKWWRQRRKQALDKAKNRCERCGEVPDKPLHVHHKSYDRLGREKASDLEVVCYKCHHYEHEGVIQADNHLRSINGSFLRLSRFQ